MKVDYHEYNKVHYPRAEALVSFIKCLHHAMQKTDDFEGAMHQLECIGYSQDFIVQMEQVAADYKEYHKQRIAMQQQSELPQVKYPMINKTRVEKYAENLRLIAKILEINDNDEILQNFEDAFASECEGMQAENILKAYLAGDVDAIICAITGYDLEEIFAKAKIIPDTQEIFHKAGDFPMNEITFPFYGKEMLTDEEFREYLRKEYTLSPEAWRLLNNVIDYAKKAFQRQEDQTECLWNMINGTIGVPEEIVRMVRL